VTNKQIKQRLHEEHSAHNTHCTLELPLDPVSLKWIRLWT